MLNTVHCLDFQDTCALLPNESVDFCFLDMPYGQTQNEWDTAPDFAVLWKSLHRVLKPKAAVCATGIEPFASRLRLSWEKGYRYDWVWVKSRKTGFLDANRKPLRAHESVIVFSKQPTAYYPQMVIGEKHKRGRSGKSNNYGGFAKLPEANSNLFYPSTLLHFPHAGAQGVAYAQETNERDNHPTEKPVPLIAYLIQTYTLPNDLVLDCFCGSGSTGVACIQTGRNYVLGDTSAEYIALTQRRLNEPIELSLFA